MTIYHIRTIADDFSFNIDPGIKGYSNNLYFESYTEPALGTTFEDYGMRTSAGKVIGYEASKYYFCTYTIGTRIRPADFPTLSSSDFVTENNTNGFIYISNYGERENNNSGWGMEQWSSRGWTNPFSNYSSWLNQLCTKFDSLDLDSVASSNPTINLIVLKYKFADFPSNGRHCLIPIFYVGNDPNFDTTITI